MQVIEGRIGTIIALGRHVDNNLQVCCPVPMKASGSIEYDQLFLGEGFPNVIGEAMACAVPCVVTGVGESPSIVDRYGVVVPPGNPDRLAQGLIKMIEMGRDKRRALGDAARQRIAQFYGMPYIAAQYENLYRDLV